MVAGFQRSDDEMYDIQTCDLSSGHTSQIRTHTIAMFRRAIAQDAAMNQAI